MGRFTQFGYRLVADMRHVHLFLSESPDLHCASRVQLPQIKNGLGENALAGPNCTVLKIDAGGGEHVVSEFALLWFDGRKLIVENHTEK